MAGTHCIGTKQVLLTPMSHQEYYDYRGWMALAENGDAAGYLVEYLDGGKGNDPHHTGYISWSPQAQADAAYRPVDRMTFGDALVLLKEGKRVARAAWVAKGQWLRLIKADSYGVSGGYMYPTGSYEESQDVVSRAPWIGIRTAKSQFGPYTANHCDMLAEDWVLVE